MAETMKGYVFKDVNDLRLEDRPIPTIQDPRDAIVRVALSSICASDFHIKVGAVPSANKDIILGHEFAGEVVAVGDACKKIKVGDRVVANVETFCGECFFCERGYVNNCVEGGWYLGHKIDGCQTEYVRVPIADNGLELIPDNLTYKDVLAVSCVLPSGYFGAELAEIKEGDTVVVLGCGPCGYTSMMSARLFKPARIIAVDRHDERGQFALDHGWADVFINSKKEDVEARVKELTEGRGADAVIEAAGKDGTFQLANTNKLIRFYEGATGLKTGSTDAALYCVSATAEKDGMELIAVVLGSPTSADRFETAKALLNYGFAGYSLVTVAPSEPISPIPVTLGTADSVQPVLTQESQILLPKAEAGKVSTTLSLPDTLQAPVEKGQELGSLTVLVDGKENQKLPLVAQEEVPRLTLWAVYQSLLGTLFCGT